jgi:Transglycosylase-like domain
MRKTIITLAALLGTAPAAIAATGPPAADAETPIPDVGLPAATHAASRDLNGSEQRLRRAAAKRARARRAGRAKPQATGPAAGVPPQLQSIAQCESGGDPSAVGGGGQFRGKYQFTYATWSAVGGSGDPAAAPEAEQDRRAAQLYASSGAGQWPVCGS